MEDTSEFVETPRKKQPKIITVWGNRKEERDRVAFYETNEAHPNGEAYVVHDGRPYQVAETTAVKRALGEGRLTTEKVNWNSLINPLPKPQAVPLAAVPAPAVEKVPDVLPATIRKGGTPGR